jgi:hypothetical protein
MKPAPGQADDGKTSGGRGVRRPSRGKTSKNSLKEVIEDALAPLADRPKSYCEFAKVGTIQADAIKAATGLDVEGFSHTVEEDDLRHTWKRHGPSGTADCTVTKEDIERIPQIVMSPDEVRIGKRPGTIEYRKNEGGNWIVVEEERRTARLLIFKTMYKEKATHS